MSTSHPRTGLILLLTALCTLASHARTGSAAHARAAQHTNAAPAEKLVPHPIRLKDGTSFSLMAPARYTIRVVAEGLGRSRFMTWSPEGRLFLTDLHNLEDNEKGIIRVFERFNPSSATFAFVGTYLEHLRNPNSIAFYKSWSGSTWMYIALTDRLIRYPYTEGEVAPGAPAEVLDTFPAYGLSYKYGGWHLTRTVSIHDGHVYVSVGSSCNACEEKEAVRASIIRMDPDGSNRTTIATGLRNAVGLTWIGDQLYATDMGADHLGDRKPNDMLYAVKEGTDYGWPYCYVDHGRVYPDNTIAWQHPHGCDGVPPPFAVFPAHAAPLGLEHFDAAFDDPSLEDATLVALHGSGVVSIGAGYQIVRVDSDGRVTPLITGFLKNGKRYGRPVDILQRDDHSFFFTDDFKGVLYYVEVAR